MHCTHAMYAVLGVMAVMCEEGCIGTLRCVRRGVCSLSICK